MERGMSLRFENGVVRTMDEKGTVASAVAVQNGRIAWVGETRDAPPAEKTVDLQGRCVLPGFTDSHGHLVSWAAGLARIDLRTFDTLEDAMEAVGKRVASAKPGEWVLGRGWVFRGWGLEGFPDRSMIDRVSGDVPVALSSMDGHVLWVNSAALRVAGIDADTPDPDGGAFERDREGRPTGILKERAADAFKERIPQDPPDRLAEALEGAQAILHGFGIVSVHAPERKKSLRALQRLRAARKLKLRVRYFLAGEELPGAASVGLEGGFGDDLLRIEGVKMFADGAVLAETAHMLEPYGKASSRGIPVTGREDLEAVIREAASFRLPVMVHAIGDAANRTVLDAIENAGGSLDRPYRIEHAQHLHEDDLVRFQKLGITASVQPIHLSLDLDQIDRALGERGANAYRFRTLLDAGVRLVFGSDMPVADPNPWFGVHAAVRRARLDGTPEEGWYPAERIGVEEAIRAYTTAPAEASGDGAERGSVEAGKRADLCVTDRDPFSIPAEDLRNVRVDLTVFDGEIVHRR